MMTELRGLFDLNQDVQEIQTQLKEMQGSLEYLSVYGGLLSQVLVDVAKLEQQMEALMKPVNVPKEEPIIYSAGERYHNSDDNKVYLVSVVGEYMYLINVESGNRWSDDASPVHEWGARPHTTSERMFGSDLGLFELVKPAQPGVFLIHNLRNDKIYVGKSDDLNTEFKRQREYLFGDKHRNQHLQNSWNLYGARYFDFAVEQKCSKSELDSVFQSILTSMDEDWTLYNFKKDFQS